MLRGNLDPSAVFTFGTEETINRETASLKADVEGRGCWMYSSGCDISPGTPVENLRRVLTALGVEQRG